MNTQHLKLIAGLLELLCKYAFFIGNGSSDDGNHYTLLSHPKICFIFSYCFLYGKAPFPVKAHNQFGGNKDNKCIHIPPPLFVPYAISCRII